MLVSDPVRGGDVHILAHALRLKNTPCLTIHQASLKSRRSKTKTPQMTFWSNKPCLTTTPNSSSSPFSLFLLLLPPPSPRHTRPTAPKNMPPPRLLMLLTSLRNPFPQCLITSLTALPCSPWRPLGAASTGWVSCHENHKEEDLRAPQPRQRKESWFFES